MSTDQAVKTGALEALRKGNNIIGIGDLQGWPRPQAYTDALAMLNTARAAAAAIPSLPPQATKPKDVAKWIDTAVEIRQREAARRDITDELVVTWERNTGAAGLAATADYTARLATLFDELIERFDAHADAPRQLTGHETPDEIEAHTAALRFAGDLTNTLINRSVIADVAQEGADVGPDPIWLVLAPHADTTRDGIQDALKEFKERFPQTLAEWDALRPLGLRLAQLGEVEARRQRHSDLTFKIAMTTPDLGQLDHSYGEIESATSTPHAQAVAANSDNTFVSA